MFFTHCQTVAEVKAEYRRLAKLHHPDRGGDTVTMQQVNATYHTVLESLNGQTSQGFDGKPHTYRYNREVEQEVIDKLAELLALNLPGIEIEIIGTWIWVSGDTKPVKDSLKAIKFAWHSKRKRWYWRRFTYRRSYTGVSFDRLRSMYGSQVIEQEQHMKQPAIVLAGS